MLFLRKIERRKWLPPDDETWLELGDIPADPLGDLRTSGNALSIWHIEDDQSNLSKVVAGNAATLGNVRNFEYSLFEGGVLADLGLTFVQNKGESFDSEANEKWHWEIVQLSGDRLLDLAKVLLPLSDGRKTVFLAEVEQLIVQAVSTKRIEFRRLKEGIQKSIRPFLPHT